MGEIQYVIDCFDGIKECCIIYNNADLICFYNTYNDNGNIESLLREYCKKYLPLYKIPNKWVMVDEFPRNSNGKIHRESLMSSYNV